MRFEKLGYRDRQNNLQKMHKRLNKSFFNNELNRIVIDFESLDEEGTEKCFGIFLGKHPFSGFETILFSYELEDYITELKTQREQILVLGTVMLHEMIHQYCYENGIDDTDHGGRWSEVAEKHGLHSVYKNGERIEEWGLPVLQFVLANFAFREKGFNE